MKRKHILISALLGMGLAFASCSDFLSVDKYFNDRLNEQKVFAKKDYSDRWLAALYSNLVNHQADVASKGYIMFNFSDDMYCGDRGNRYRTFKFGEYDENWFNDSYDQCYMSIRDASTMIQNIDINEELSKEEIADYKAQARFLRAYYYWLLLRRYGPIPLLPDEGLDYTASYDDLAVPRSSYKTCAEYISNELALAAKDLPLERSNREINKATRGTALAARAKVLLFAASPLNNGNKDMAELVDDEGNCLIPQEYDEEMWAKAAAAAKDVMELNRYSLYVAPFREHDVNHGYPATIVPPHNDEFSDKDWPEGWKNIDPFESYRSIFDGDIRPSDNPELIFTRGANQTQENCIELARHQFPSSLNGWNTHGISLKQCDAYYMNDGTDMPGMNNYMPGDYPNRDNRERPKGYVTREDVEEGRYKPLSEGVYLEYANREPRFYASVAYNGSVWDMTSLNDENMRYKQVFYYRGQQDGMRPSAPEFWLRTGIGVKKYCNPQDAFVKDGNPAGWEGHRVIDKADPSIRYAEVLLIYAEALNELDGSYTIPSYDGSKTYQISRDVNEMKKGIRPIRIRAGVPDYDASTYADKAQFRKKLKRERQIELFAEGHRYFDLRRWKDAPVEEATPIYGCNMNMTEKYRDLFYEPYVVPSLPTVFSKKMYYWPIPHQELKRNRRLTQNPGWTSFD